MILKFLLFLALTFSQFVHAETIPASTGGYGYPCSVGGTKSAATRAEACSLGTTCTQTAGFAPSQWGPGSFTLTADGLSCRLNASNGTLYGTVPLNPVGFNSCPTGQNWTLSGATCTRPDCAADEVRDSGTGICSCAPGKTSVNGVCTTVCPTGYHNQVPDSGQCIKNCVGSQTQGSDGVCVCENKRFMTTGSYTAFNSRCVGGCSISWSAGFSNPVDVAKYLAKQIPITSVGVAAYVSQSGATCESAPNLVNVTLAPLPQDTSGKNAAGTAPDPLNKPETNQSPEACTGVGGSYAVINGKSSCLTDKGNAFQKLTVDAASKTTTNPDGSSSVTTDNKITVKDPVTGEVKTVSESSTVTKDANGNVTGTGTTASEGTSRDSDLCTKNPGLQICKGGLNEEVTQKRVADALTVDTKDYSDITSADTAAKVLEAKQAALDAVTSAIADLNKIGTASDPAKVYQEQVSAALSGWFDAIPTSTCAPVGGTIGNRTFSIDICPTAAKISEIGAYALWVMFAFGTFAMVTRKAE